MKAELIDRQRAIDVLDTGLWGVKWDKALATAMLKDLPSADRKGHWRGYNADNPDWLRTDGSPIFMSCSECNGTVLNNGSAHWNYCPSCGARMERE